MAEKKKPPPPYDGEELSMCLPQAFDWAHTTAVVVSGDSWNPCGHMLLKVGDGAPFYFHVAGPYMRPQYMRELDFRRYLRESRKTVLSQRPVKITKPDAAQFKLDQLMSKKWLWLMAPNNCASFLEEIVQAGGSTAGLYLNCPTLERFK
ncbi:hypothetical protein [Roseateles amylovorans]|uniref:Tox-REase-5 domain-containing protein n=1 Tax=Roseateles amylovorans TaxID=2978473 RepID=A0ABY6B4J0_9BURK|nr:hypothetical protein [Roseateles amylovorans]UXH80109.1 hypothetical protein N4261_09590 [Roseateles amylovorans]